MPDARTHKTHYSCRSASLFKWQACTLFCQVCHVGGRKWPFQLRGSQCDGHSICNVQDATFSELLRRLQKLDVDPQLPAEVAAAAAPAEEDAGDAATRIRAVCQSSANIDFAAALEIARRARIAKVSFGCTNCMPSADTSAASLFGHA